MKEMLIGGSVGLPIKPILTFNQPNNIKLTPKTLFISNTYSSSSFLPKLQLKSPLKQPLKYNNTWTRITFSLFSFLCPSSPAFMASSDSRVSVEVYENGTIGEKGKNNENVTEVIIVRHGETDWNAIGKMQGQLDVDLNEMGRQQAAAVAERLSRESDIAAIYSSDLKRALVTAETIAAKCGGFEVTTDEGLRERHLGDLQGVVYQDLPKLKPRAYEALRSTKMDQEIPGGGESRDQLYKRCTSCVQRIGEKHRGQRVIVVSHGGVIRSLYSRADHKGHPAGKISNTSVGVIQLLDGDVWSIKSWNDVSHLRETEFLESAFGGDASSG